MVTDGEKTKVKQGRLDLLLMRLAEEGLDRLEKRWEVPGLRESLMPEAKRLIGKLGVPKRRCW